MLSTELLSCRGMWTCVGLLGVFARVKEPGTRTSCLEDFNRYRAFPFVACYDALNGLQRLATSYRLPEHQCRADLTEGKFSNKRQVREIQDPIGLRVDGWEERTTVRASLNPLES